MTILNFALLSDDAAVVAVDTRTSGQRWASKMIVLPHLGAIVAGRGRLSAFTSAALMLNLYATFDEAADALPGLFETALRMAGPDEFAGAGAVALSERLYGDRDTLFKQELLLVGRSPRRGFVTGVYAARPAEGAPTETSANLGSCIAPDIELDPSMLGTDEGALKMARAQYAERLALDGGAGFGGHLIVARLSTQPETRISTRDLGEL